MSNLIKKSLNYCDARKSSGLYRTRKVQDESYLLNFSCNDYLSLQNNPELKAAYIEGYKRYASGSTGSAVVSGYQDIHCEVEEAFARALQVESAILFSSGYAANLSIGMLLAALNAKVFIDKYIHASIYDGLRLANINYFRYPHLQFNKLEQLLKQASGTKVLYTESVFSMGGGKTSFNSLNCLQGQEKFDLIVDEAHAFGVYGPEGFGALTEPELRDLQVPLRVIPLGKAGCAAGAIVAGNKSVIEALVQVARPYIYSTAMSPAFAHGLLKTLEFIRNADEARKRLFSLISYFRAKINASCVEMTWKNSTTPIQHLAIGCSFETMRISEILKSQHIYCIPMRRPTVSQVDTGFRVILNANHTEADIDRLLAVLHVIPNVVRDLRVLGEPSQVQDDVVKGL